MTDIESELARVREHLLNWLLNDALPIWWTVGADKTGGFHEAIDLAGQPVLGERRARVQARQIFTYAVAGELGWSGPWREAVRHGLDFYIGRYRRPDGLFVNALLTDGSPSPATPHVYEQAFAMLAIATAEPCFAGADRRRGARAAVYRAPRSRRAATPDLPTTASSNPTRTCICSRRPLPGSGSRRIRAGARWPTRSPSSASRRFMTRGGLLLEYFDASWAPAAGIARTARVAGPSVRMGRTARALGPAPGPRGRAQGCAAALSLRRRPRRRSEARRRRLRAARRPDGERRQGAALVADRMAEGGAHPRALRVRRGTAALPGRRDRRGEGADALSATRRSPGSGATSSWATAAGSTSPRRQARSITSSTPCACWPPGRPIRCSTIRPRAGVQRRDVVRPSAGRGRPLAGGPRLRVPAATAAPC